MKAVLSHIDSANPQSAMDRLMGDLFMISRWIFDFTQGCMVTILAKYLDPDNLKQEFEVVVDSPPISGVSIPFFVSKV